MSPEIENEVLDSVALNRRAFVKKVVLGSAFAVPLVASFEMRSLTASAADCITPNQTTDIADGTFQIEILNLDAKSKNLKFKIKVRDQGTGHNVSKESLNVKLRKIDPKPSHGPDLPVKFNFKNSQKLGRHYELKLDTSKWADGVYELIYKVGDDKHKFSVGYLVGDC